MDEDTQRRCLEPFFTTKGERGTGLGLAMVYGIAQRHEVEIDIASTPGAGYHFPPDVPGTRGAGRRKAARRLRRKCRCAPASC